MKKVISGLKARGAVGNGAILKVLLVSLALAVIAMTILLVSWA